MDLIHSGLDEKTCEEKAYSNNHNIHSNIHSMKAAVDKRKFLIKRRLKDVYISYCSSLDDNKAM